MKPESSKHHYIPRFVSKGFVNSSRLIYIYDKEEDKIKDNPRPPGSIFHEENRNTISINQTDSSSVIEDKIFKKLDNDTGKIVNKLQNNLINKELLSNENQAIFQFFIITLFWRLPFTDYAVSDLNKRAVIKSVGIDPEILRNDEAFQKLKRAGLYENTIDQMGKGQRPKETNFIKLSEFESDLFILGDNPILFRSVPQKFTDLVYMDYLFAVSSKRVYSSTLGEIGTLTRHSGYDFNSLIIEQSQKYIVSGNLKLLEDSINYYKKLKEEKILYSIKELLFSNNGLQ